MSFARRRGCIKPNLNLLNEDYMPLFSPSVPINHFLLIVDTSKRLEETEKSRHTQGRVVARTNLQVVTNDLSLSNKALHSVLFRKTAIPLRITISETAGGSRPPVNVQTTDNVSNPNIVYFQGDCFPLISTQFKAGRLKDFAQCWKKLTSDAVILDTVLHCQIEFKRKILMLPA